MSELLQDIKSDNSTLSYKEKIYIESLYPEQEPVVEVKRNKKVTFKEPEAEVIEEVQPLQAQAQAQQPQPKESENKYKKYVTVTFLFLLLGPTSCITDKYLTSNTYLNIVIRTLLFILSLYILDKLF
jgi:hypothetical protein